MMFIFGLQGINVMKKLIEFISLKILSPIKFDRIVFLFKGSYYNLTPKDRYLINELMEKGNYIWLSRRKTHLTTYLISLADFCLGLIKYIKRKGPFPKLNFSKYTHAFFNISDDILIEAIGKGVIESYFDDVFDCDWACALKLKNVSEQHWNIISTKMVEMSFNEIGKKYDTLFNLKNDNELSCVELIRVLLIKSIGLVDYEKYLFDFENLINYEGNLTPQMIRDSISFDVIFEVKR